MPLFRSAVLVLMFTSSIARAFTATAFVPTRRTARVLGRRGRLVQVLVVPPPRRGRSSLAFLWPSSPTIASSRPISPRDFGARHLSGSSSSESSTTIVDTCESKIRTALDAVRVKVTGAYDDPNGSHISIEVVSSKFEGKRPVQRQQLVYKAIWEELQGPVHAVDSMVCMTPAEASS